MDNKIWDKVDLDFSANLNGDCDECDEFEGLCDKHNEEFREKIEQLIRADERTKINKEWDTTAREEVRKKTATQIFAELDNSLFRKRIEYYNGDGKQVISHECNFCKSIPENAPDDEIDDHMKHCKCSECMGYLKNTIYITQEDKYLVLKSKYDIK